MRVLIIEDEVNAAMDLQKMIMKQDPAFQIVAIKDSIDSSLEWLEQHDEPDLIFSDIQLADGLSFEIFQRHPITCPIIFTTAYDEYAIQAFELNGIAYLLKPTDEKKLVMSLQKIETFRANLTRAKTTPPGAVLHLEGLLKSIQTGYKPYRTSLLISHKGKIFPLSVADVSYFIIRHGVTYVYTCAGKDYIVPQTLEDLEQCLDPAEFYRANRQYLIAFKAIKEVEQYLGRRVLIHVDVKVEEKIIVSKPRSSDFLSWMENR